MAAVGPVSKGFPNSGADEGQVGVVLPSARLTVLSHAVASEICNLVSF